MAYSATTSATSMWTTTIADSGDSTKSTYRIVTSKGAKGASSITISKTVGSGDSKQYEDENIGHFHDELVKFLMGTTAPSQNYCIGKTNAGL